MSSVFDELVGVAALTLGRSVAPFTLGRLLLRARVFDREAMTLETARGALPILEEGLAEFLTRAELAATMQGFAAVLARREQSDDGSAANQSAPLPWRGVRGRRGEGPPARGLDLRRTHYAMTHYPLGRERWRLPRARRLTMWQLDRVHRVAVAFDQGYTS